jgi:hypothetical protein
VGLPIKEVLKSSSWSAKAGLTIGPTAVMLIAAWAADKAWDDYSAVRDAVGSCVTAAELDEVHTRIDAEHEVGVIHDTILTHMVIGGVR